MPSSSAPATASTSSWSRPSSAGSEGTSRRCSAHRDRVRLDDYINWRLTGQSALERNWALEAGFVDLHSGQIAPELVELAHIAPEALPPVRAAHEVIGEVTRAAAAASGLAAGTPVVAGCADHVASAFVAGIRQEGDLLLKFGGAGDILLATDRPRPDPRLSRLPHRAGPVHAERLHGLLGRAPELDRAPSPS